MTAPTPAPKPSPGRAPDDDEERVPRGRLAVWGLLALVILIGLVLYFRFEPGIAPLFDRVH